MDRKQVSIELTSKLSALPDAARNEELTSELQLPPDPREAQSRVLSSSVTSTASSSALLNTAKQGSSVCFRTIGFGQCGMVFERPGRAYVVKIARPAFENALWADFQAHLAIYQAFRNQQSVKVGIPQFFAYVTKTNDKWWDSHVNLFHGSHPPFPMSAMALITERILPLPKLARQALIDAYCPGSSQLTAAAEDTNRDCLTYIYLGRHQPYIAPTTTETTYSPAILADVGDRIKVR